MRSWGVGALLSLPLFDGGSRRAEVQAWLARHHGQAIAEVASMQVWQPLAFQMRRIAE